MFAVFITCVLLSRISEASTLNETTHDIHEGNMKETVIVSYFKCGNEPFLNISWSNQTAGTSSLEVGVRKKNESTCPHNLGYEGERGDRFVTLRENPENGCKILPLQWKNITSGELRFTTSNSFPDFVNNRCNCSGSGPLELEKVECNWGEALWITYSDNSTTYNGIQQVTSRDSQTGNHTTLTCNHTGKYLEIYNQELKTDRDYHLTVTYYDWYCQYNTSMEFNLTDVPRCSCDNILELRDVEPTSQKNQYEITYFSREQEFEEITVLFNLTSKITLQNTTLTKGRGRLSLYIDNLEANMNYTLNVSYEVSKTHCRNNTSMEFSILVSTTEFNYTLLLLLVPIFFVLGYTSLAIWKRTKALKYFLMIPQDSLPRLRRRYTRTAREEVNSLYTPLELTQEIPRSDPYEFPREEIEIKELLGEGTFGKVFSAEARGLFGIKGCTAVAVKRMKENAPAEDVLDFKKEIEMLKKIGHHKHIVRLLAQVTSSEPYMMIMELIFAGDLREYLLKVREIWSKRDCGTVFFNRNSDGAYIETQLNFKCKKNDGSPYVRRNQNGSVDSALPDSPNSLILSEVSNLSDDSISLSLENVSSGPEAVLDNKELENFAKQIANGMAYLEKLGITHRDLAARNILITDSKLLKISDFGMSRAGPYFHRTGKLVPIRWWAIESISEFKADSKSDVWSFGVVLWEIGTLGANPYGKLPNDMLLPYLKAGNRLPRPEICTDELYAIILKCWSECPENRPSFKQVEDMLNKKKKPAYGEFSKLKANYAFPPVYRED